MAYLGDICFGEEYQKDGETKKKWTKIGGLFQTDKGYSVKINGQFLPVFEKKENTKTSEISVEDIPFN